jgi:signal peptidase II
LGFLPDADLLRFVDLDVPTEPRALPNVVAGTSIMKIPLNRYVLFILTAALGCAADLGTKAYFFSLPELRAGAIEWLWTGHVGVQLSWNQGALFGIGQGQVWLFATLSILAAIAIPLWLFRYAQEPDAWLTFALGCVMGGVLGNLYDRVGLHGEVWPPSASNAGQAIHAVRDWILWQLNDAWRWPNFNIADSLLVVGTAILMLHALRQSHAPTEHSASKTSGSSASAS